MEARVAQYMTEVPYCIEVDDTIAAAVAMMSKYKIRHLPVVEGPRTAGVISDRDIRLALALGASDIEKKSIRLAYSPAPFEVSPHTPVLEVVKQLRDHRYGCAVVSEDNQIKGIFTVVDALPTTKFPLLSTTKVSVIVPPESLPM